MNIVIVIFNYLELPFKLFCIEGPYGLSTLPSLVHFISNRFIEGIFPVNEFRRSLELIDCFLHIPRIYFGVSVHSHACDDKQWKLNVGVKNKVQAEQVYQRGT